jgi:hypothetical protein
MYFYRKKKGIAEEGILISFFITLANLDQHTS